MRRICFVMLFLFLFIPTAVAQPADLPAPESVQDAGLVDAGSVDAGLVDVGPVDVGSANPQPVGPPHDPPEDIGDALEDVNLLIEAAKNGWWGLFAGLLIMLLIFIADKLIGIKEKIGEAAVPWVAAVLGILGAIGAQLTTGVHWGLAILQGVTAGVSAVGLWEMVFKQALGDKDE